MDNITQSDKLNNVCYDIRGPVLDHARRMEEDGHQILRLNIGNPAPFGFHAPDEILHDVIHNLSDAQGYCDSKGLYSARKAIMQECQKLGINGVDIGLALFAIIDPHELFSVDVIGCPVKFMERHHPPI